MASNYKKRKAKGALDLGDRLFKKKEPLDRLNQEIALQFTPDLATFDGDMELGEDIMDDVMDSTPLQMSRELSNMQSAILRPSDKIWFRSTTLDDEVDAVEENARGLQHLTRQVWSGIYNPRTQFIASSKEADRFYVNFGYAVLACNEAPSTRDHLLYKNYHVKDCVFLENEIGQVDHLHRKQKMTARQLGLRFGKDALHPSVQRAITREPEKEFEMRVITMPREEYDDITSGEEGRGSGRRQKLPFVVCYLDYENCHVMRDSGLAGFNYIVPRWHRYAGSQYAFSPATMTALPDARMAQMLAQILLDAGEKAVDPPLVGKQEVVIGEPNIMSGAISWIDAEHDGKLSDALEALRIDPDMRVGFQMRQDIRDLLTRAFYIDRLELPEVADRTTAFEIARRIEQHARNLLPLFEPMQIEYNTRALDVSFTFLQNMKKIDWDPVPDQLGGADFTWSFESPIAQARHRIMVEQFRDTLQVCAAAKEMGLMASPIHIDIATRDAIRGIDGPATWRKTQAEQQEEAAANEQKAAMAEVLATATQAGQAGTQLGEAGQKMGLIPPGGPLMPTTDQAIPADTGVPENSPTGAPTPSNGARSVAEMLQQLAGEGLDVGGGGALPPGVSEGELVPQGDPSDLLALQQRILMKLSEFEEILKQPRQVSVERDSNGRVTGAKATPGERGDGRVAA